MQKLMGMSSAYKWWKWRTEVVASRVVEDRETMFMDIPSTFAGIISINEGSDQKCITGVHLHCWLILYKGSILWETNLRWRPTTWVATSCSSSFTRLVPDKPEERGKVCPESPVTSSQPSAPFFHHLKSTKADPQSYFSRGLHSASCYLLLTGGLTRKRIKIVLQELCIQVVPEK